MQDMGDQFQTTSRTYIFIKATAVRSGFGLFFRLLVGRLGFVFPNSTNSETMKEIA